MKPILTIIFLAALLGCTNHRVVKSDENPAEDNLQQTGDNVADNKDKVICTREATVGTHFKEKRCRTVGQIEAEREEARKILEQATRTKPSSSD